MSDRDFGIRLTTDGIEQEIIYAVPPDLLELLDLPLDATVDDAVRRIDELKIRKARIEQFIRDEVQRLVDGAIKPDTTGVSKLHESEREEVTQMGLALGLTVLKSFIDARQPIYAWMRDLANKNHTNQAAAVISVIQKRINYQLGVSEQLFKRYNT
jgi:phage I-like protein